MDNNSILEQVFYREDSPSHYPVWRTILPKEHLHQVIDHTETLTKSIHRQRGPKAQWAAGGFEEFLNIMNFYVFLIVWDNRVNKL